MSRIIRTVSLDKESDERAAEKPNFSAWVREQLKKEDRFTMRSHPTQAIFNQKGICNPNASPRCGICYPYGKPGIVEIRAYNTGLISKEELFKSTKKNEKNGITSVMSDLNPVGEEKEPKDPPLRERKFVRRLVKWLIEWI